MSILTTWTGCFEVLLTERAQQYGEADAYGAFVNAVAYANSQSHFRQLANDAFDRDGYQVIDVEDVLEIDLADSGFPPDELEFILESLRAGTTVAFGYFHTYPKDGFDA